MFHWFRRNVATIIKEEDMTNHRLRHIVFSFAVVLGFAASMPGIAIAAETTSAHTTPVMPAYAYITMNTAVQPLAMAFVKLEARVKQGTNACDPITPQNWCACGGCAGSNG